MEAVRGIPACNGAEMATQWSELLADAGTDHSTVVVAVWFHFTAMKAIAASAQAVAISGGYSASSCDGNFVTAPLHVSGFQGRCGSPVRVHFSLHSHHFSRNNLS